MKARRVLNPEERELIEEAIRGALVEIEQCADISQGVEDDLNMALSLLVEEEIE